MKYLLISIAALITVSAHARLQCSTTCTLKGQSITESQNFIFFDGEVHGTAFGIDDYNGENILGGMRSNGHPGTFCGDRITRVWIELNGEYLSQEDNEILFNIDGIPHKFSCELNGQTWQLSKFQ